MRKFNLILSIVFLIFIGILPSGCVVPLGRVFSSYSYCVSNALESSYIVGTWIPDKATLGDIRIRGKYDYKISTSTKLIFGENGSFEMVNLPDWWISNFGESHGGFTSQRGTWKLSTNNKCYFIELNLPSVNTDFGLRKHKFGGNPEYIIERIIGDPDSNESMVFIKQ